MVGGSFISSLLMGMLLLPSHSRGAEEWLLGVEEVTGPLPYVEWGPLRLRTLEDGDQVAPLTLILPRCRYWLEDGHLEALVLLSPPVGVELSETSLRVEWIPATGDAETIGTIESPEWNNLAFYPRIPADFTGEAQLSVKWMAGDDILGEQSAPFRVEQFSPAVAPAGKIPLHIPNPQHITVDGLPVTVGVPFPRGLVDDPATLRLVDADGYQLPVQIETTGRWSKFGSLKWVRCDFTADLAGAPQTVYLEYGQRQDAGSAAAIPITGNPGGFPSIDAGILVTGDGLWADLNGDGQRVKILDARALAGGFVEHENGNVYRMPLQADYTVEESGPHKIVLLRRGWHLSDDADAAPFCKYEVRYVIYRDSPLLRIFHTWIFTGDSSRDRIRTMGWQLPLASPLTADGSFRTAFGPDGQWQAGDFLLQYNHNEFEIAAADEDTIRFANGRAPGIARAPLEGGTLYFGARNFWQSFPSELEFADDSLWFHSWPRHGVPRPDPVVDPSRAVMLDFAHTGEVLDLRLPDAYAEGPLDHSHAAHDTAIERVWITGEPESVNAQGLARTEEFWLYTAPKGADSNTIVALLEGIDQETLRAVVAPKWMAESGVFYEIHHRDTDNYPTFEELFGEDIAPADSRQADAIGLYGMWLYGERLWDWHNHSNLYRALRKGHGGYGALSWMPYARSGDPQLLKWQDASMRRMIDANFCHYVSPDVAEKARGARDITRRPGFWARGPLPWAGRGIGVLCYERQPHQWWSAWHMTGYHRARDMGFTYRDLAKEYIPEMYRFNDGNRTIETIQKAFVDSYENTFDPWFLLWSHTFAAFHREAWQRDRWQPYGRHWSTGDREYHRFSGCREHAEFYAEFVRSSVGSPGALAYAWQITGDEWFLRRLSALYLNFTEAGQGGGSGSRVDSSSELPMMLAAFEAAGGRPPALNNTFAQRLNAYEDGETRVFRTPTTAFIKAEGEPLDLFLGLIRLQTYRRENDQRTYWIHGPDGELFASGDFSIGTYENRPGMTVTIPADAPPGIYQLQTEFRSTQPDSTHGYIQLRGIRFPVTPPGTPEVFILTEEQMGPTSMGGVHFTPAYTFYVPEDVESFEVQNITSRTGAVIRNADDEIVWQHPPGTAEQVTIDVPANQRGRLWYIRGGRFTMDPAIPPYYAIDSDRWFLP